MLGKYKWIVFLALLLILALIGSGFLLSNWFSGALPFSVSYHSWLEFPLIGIFNIWAVFTILVLILYPGRQIMHRALFIVNFICMIFTVIAWIIYHSTYSGNPMVMVFMDAEPVEPYHIQLGRICSVYFLFLSLVFLPAKLNWLWRIGAVVLALSFLLFVNIQ